jgi:DinB superfamily
MTVEESLVRTAVGTWKNNIDRANKLFAGASDDRLQQEIAPGKNRLIYLWGHLIAVHDAMLPLLGIGPRRYADLDAAFLEGADRAVDIVLTRDELKARWDATSGALQEAFDRFTAADWTSRHTVVSEADFAANPLRNRLSVVLNRAAHVSYHLGQAALAPE